MLCYISCGIGTKPGLHSITIRIASPQKPPALGWTTKRKQEPKKPHYQGTGNQETGTQRNHEIKEPRILEKQLLSLRKVPSKKRISRLCNKNASQRTKPPSTWVPKRHLHEQTSTTMMQNEKLFRIFCPRIKTTNCFMSNHITSLTNWHWLMGLAELATGELVGRNRGELEKQKTLQEKLSFTMFHGHSVSKRPSKKQEPLHSKLLRKNLNFTISRSRTCQECPIDLLRATVEECRAANVAQATIDEALRCRALGMNEADQRMIMGFGQDDEKRASYNRAVALLHESIQTGKSVPAEFEELMNELIVNHVM